MILSVYSCPVDNIVHEYERLQYSSHGNNRGDTGGDDGDERQDISSDDGDERGDISIDYGRHIFWSQETIHSSSRNRGETVGGDVEVDIGPKPAIIPTIT